MASKDRPRGREGDSPIFPSGKLGQSPGVVLLLAWLLVVLGFLACGAPALADDPLDERRKEIAGMDRAEKERLQRNYERFLDLDRTEQVRIRRLHKDIERDPNTDELRQVMDRYYQWLRKLSPYERAQLQDLAADKRIDEIRKLRQEEAEQEAERTRYVNLPRAERFKRALRDPRSRFLTEQDVETLFGWIEEVGPTYKTRFLENMPEDRRRQWRDELEKAKDPKRQQEMFARMWLRLLMDYRGDLPPEVEKEVDRLTARFSESTQKRLAAMPEDERRRTIARWIAQVIIVEFVMHRPAPRLPGVSDDELADFLETGVDPSRRAWLLSLPGDEMERQLKFMYLRSKMKDGLSLPSGGPWQRGRFRSFLDASRGGGQRPGDSRMEPGGPGRKELPPPPGGPAPRERPRPADRSGPAADQRR